MPSIYDHYIVKCKALRIVIAPFPVPRPLLLTVVAVVADGEGRPLLGLREVGSQAEAVIYTYIVYN